MKIIKENKNLGTLTFDCGNCGTTFSAERGEYTQELGEDIRNELNGKPITTSHGFSHDDSFFSNLGVEVGVEKIDENHSRQICEYYNVIRIENRKQSWGDKFWNGTYYEFFTLDYILEMLQSPQKGRRLTKRPLDKSQHRL